MSDLVRSIKRNKFIKELYRKISAKMAFSPDGIIKAVPQIDGEEPFRVNLLLLGINENEVFGGVSTALKILKLISNELSCDMRIIVTGNQRLNSSTYIPEGFNPSDGSLIFLEENRNIKVGRNDLFIFTYWTTWFSFDDVLIHVENKCAGENLKYLYLIQDFEPGFFPWSTEYLLAESTYRKRSDNTIALINSNELAGYISDRDLRFFSSHTFTPILNNSLKNELFKYVNKDIDREKIILIYGRPSAKRNAFELLVSALRRWSDSFSGASDWRIISLGEKHDDIQLSNNLIVSYGKVSLEEYANLMIRSYAGISLMASPHPSYPPLEMSAFGVKVITNRFENKTLEGFSSNLCAVEVCTPEVICDKLSTICSSCSDQNRVKQFIVDCPDEYLSSAGLKEVIKEICLEIDAKKLCDELGEQEL